MGFGGGRLRYTISLTHCFYFCRLPCNQVWCAYDVSVCFLHNHNVSFIYVERDANAHAEIHRFFSFHLLFNPNNTKEIYLEL